MALMYYFGSKGNDRQDQKSPSGMRMIHSPAIHPVLGVATACNRERASWQDSDV